MKFILQISVLSLFVGCANPSRISEIPDIAAMSFVHGEVVAEYPSDGDVVRLYDEEYILVWICKGSDVACAEVQASSEMCQLTDAITACLMRGVKKVVFFWKGSDPVVKNDVALEPCAMPLCPAVNLDSFRSRIVLVNLVRGDCIFVNGMAIRSEEEMYSCFEKLKCSMPNAEVAIRADKRSHTSSIRRIVRACTSSGFWNIFLVGQNDEGQSTIYPINVPCPGRMGLSETIESGMLTSVGGIDK